MGRGAAYLALLRHGFGEQTTATFSLFSLPFYYLFNSTFICAPLVRKVNCYNRKGLADTLLSAIQKELGDKPQLKPDDLAPIDEFHIRGRESTKELAGLLGEFDSQEILDVGCGLGGTARYLASSFGCRVTGIDLTPTYISLAERLSQMVGLTNETNFYEASAVELPFPEEEFDIAWMEHVQMNIPSKDQLACKNLPDSSLP